MSADDAGDDRAIRIRLPGFDEQGRPRVLVPSPGWPRLPPPERRELLLAYFDRVLFGDSVYQRVSQEFGCEPRLSAFHPAEMTLPKWTDRYPDKPLQRTYGDPRASRTYYPNMVRDRLLVALCDALQRRALELRGFCLRSPAEEEPVPLALLRSNSMLLDPNTDGGQLRLEGPLPVYRELTLWPGADAPAEAVPQATDATPGSSARGHATASAVSAAHPRRNHTAGDAKLVDIMHKAITRKRNSAKDATDAARQVVKMAEGEGTEESKVKRLVVRYYQIHPKQPPTRKKRDMRL